MAYKKPIDLIFGKSLNPLKYGFDLEVGNGKVIPEVKYWPRRGTEDSVQKTVKEFKEITIDLLERAVSLGISDLQLETELNYKVTENPKLAREIIETQINIMDKFYTKYGIRIALRATIADIRGLRDLTFQNALQTIFEAFEEVADAGAHVLSIESLGGKEVFDYSLLRGDIEGIIYSLGILAVRDMKRLWREIVNIARRHNSIAGGDTACGFANTAMKLANGYLKPMLPHTYAAIIRALSASRSLVAYEMGARGPGKDCGYENVIIKAVTGYPMSMEGKSSAVAHSSLFGNIVAATCDLWSNEQVENIKLFGGTGPQVFLEILHYDVELMNIALRMGRERILRQMMVESDMYRDPQSLILSPSSAWRIGYKIVENNDIYTRTLQAGLEAISIIRESLEKKLLKIDLKEKKWLNKLENKIRSLPEEENILIDRVERKYRIKIPSFNPRNYEI